MQVKKYTPQTAKKQGDPRSFSIGDTSNFTSYYTYLIIRGTIVFVVMGIIWIIKNLTIFK